MRKRFGSVQLNKTTRLTAHTYTLIHKEPSGAIIESLVAIHHVCVPKGELLNGALDQDSSHLFNQNEYEANFTVLDDGSPAVAEIQLTGKSRSKFLSFLDQSGACSKPRWPLPPWRFLSVELRPRPGLESQARSAVPSCSGRAALHSRAPRETFANGTPGPRARRRSRRGTLSASTRRPC